MITKFFIFILVFSSLIIISNFITRNNKERFQDNSTTQSQTTQASEDNSTTQVSEDNSTTQASEDNSTTQVSEDNSTTQVSEDNSTTQAKNNEVILSDYETIPQETEIETNYDNFFPGGFCKFQEKLGYQVGCSDHIYDNAFFDIDRELNSVKSEKYSFLKSKLKS